MLKAYQIMTTDVFTIPASATVAQAIEAMQQMKVRSLIIKPAQALDSYGIVTERDIAYEVVAFNTDPETISVAEIMRKPCLQIAPETSVQEAAQYFSDTAIHRAPVVDSRGRLCGILSITDIIMKGLTHQTAVADHLSQRIQTAIRHARIICDQEASMAQDCAIAWDVIETETEF